MNAKKADAQARLRAELILKVRSGMVTAAEAAAQLGVSRKTYYKWEKRALSGMLAALCARNSGRPASGADAEKEKLKQRITELEKELSIQEQRQTLRDLLRGEEKKQ